MKSRELRSNYCTQMSDYAATAWSSLGTLKTSLTERASQTLSLPIVKNFKKKLADNFAYFAPEAILFYFNPRSVISTCWKRSYQTKNVVSLNHLGYVSGWVTGYRHIAIIWPRNKQEFETLIDRLDMKPEGRDHIKSSTQAFLGTLCFFNEVKLREKKAGSMSQAHTLRSALAFENSKMREVAQCIIEYLDTNKKYIFHDEKMYNFHIDKIVFIAIEKILFYKNIDSPHDSDGYYQLIFSDAIHSVFDFTLSPGRGLSFNDSKDAFNKFSEKFLETQLNLVYDLIHKRNLDDNIQSNIIIKLIVDYIKFNKMAGEDHQAYLRSLSKDQIKEQFFSIPEIRTLPFVFITTINPLALLRIAINWLVKRITLFMDEDLNNDDRLFCEILDELEEQGLMMDDLPENSEDYRVSDLDINRLLDASLPKLEQFYYECLRISTQSPILRYTKEGITAGEISVPEKSLVYIDIAGKMSKKFFNPTLFQKLTIPGTRKEHDAKTQSSSAEFGFFPFSVGRRACPAAKFTDIIVKAVLVPIINELAHENRLIQLRRIARVQPRSFD